MAASRTARPPAGPDAEAGATRGLLQIGDVAERTGLSLRTVRHYEEVGLLVPAGRSKGGFRLYTETAVERLLVIKQMKPLGFPLEQMRDVLETLDALADPATPAERRQGLQAALADHHRAVAASVEELRARLDRAREFQQELAARLADEGPGGERRGGVRARRQ